MLNTLAPPQVVNTINTLDVDNPLSASGARGVHAEPVANNTIDPSRPVEQHQVIPEEEDMHQGATSNFGNTT